MSGRTIYRTIGVLGGVAALALTLSARSAQGTPLQRLARLEVKTGYIDAHFAVSGNGAMLAFFHVGEGSAPSRMEIHDLKGAKPRQIAKVDVSKLTVAPVGLRFTPDSQRLLVFSERAAQGSIRPKEAFVFDTTGRQVGRIFPFNELAFRKGPGGWEIVTYHKAQTGARVAHEVSLYSIANLKRTATARLVSEPNGEVTTPPMQIAFFSPDFSQIVVKVAGAYDKQRDMRLPDRQKVYDPFTRKFLTDKEISNLADWATLQKLRSENQRIPTLLQLTGTQKSPAFEMITPAHERVRLPNTTPPLKQFEFKSLVQQNTDAPTVPFSLNVDPQWPTLFGENRSVPEVFHLFLLDPGSKQIRLLGTVDAPGQVIGWRLGGARLAVMRLHANWKLGDRAIEIYDVPGAK
ncbi:MAG: hypothetical protein RBU30_15910 [Polyangia bacterium]|jgi:hypothetical protein|nr:hypothetical protein [Polyangia bacterium]